jgi:hypothetical protein
MPLPALVNCLPVERLRRISLRYSRSSNNIVSQMRPLGRVPSGNILFNYLFIGENGQPAANRFPPPSRP